MKRLVIHPDDNSTRFLCKVYRDLDDVTLVQGGVNKDGLKAMMKEHDQIIMLGHGTPLGLMSVGRFDNKDWNIVDDSFAELLSEKDNSIFIWCNADRFVDHHKLNGFYTGMFISEVGEAYGCGIHNASQQEVDQSNHAFAEIVNKAIDAESRATILTSVAMHMTIKEQYGRMVSSNRVAEHNQLRLHVR